MLVKEHCSNALGGIDQSCLLQPSLNKCTYNIKVHAKLCNLTNASSSSMEGQAFCSILASI